jgi:uncharacterized protein YodC (DUF2158 family)
VQEQAVGNQTRCVYQAVTGYWSQGVLDLRPGATREEADAALGRLPPPTPGMYRAVAWASALPEGGWHFRCLDVQAACPFVGRTPEVLPLEQLQPKPEAPPAIKVGDQVTLRSGGPVMTVVGGGGPTRDRMTVAHCGWFTARDSAKNDFKYREVKLPVAVLVRLPARPGS